MKYNAALDLANEIADILAAACIRHEIVGSVKRADKPDVHDIEILLIPKTAHPIPEFGKRDQVYKNILEKLLADMEKEGKIGQPNRKADGSRYKKRAILGTGELNEFCLDLFIVNEETWGIQNVIRTGPGLFSHRFVTNKNKTAFDKTLMRGFPGFLPNDLSYIASETKIKRGSTTLELPEERDAIELLGSGWIAPNQRTAWAIK